eukprot:936198_1
MATSFTLINDQSRHLCNYSCFQHLVDVSHWMSGTAWIEMSLSLSSLCDGASCAEWLFCLIVYVDAVNHDSDRYDPDIQMDAPFGLHMTMEIGRVIGYVTTIGTNLFVMI